MHWRRWSRTGDPENYHGRRIRGYKRTPTHISYTSMLARCTKPKNENYPYYGGRGITVCDRWLGVDGFANFLEDMGERPEGMTLDRINTDGNYEPSNCRWATPKEQAATRRRKPRRDPSTGRYMSEEAGKHGAAGHSREEAPQ